MLLAGLAWAAPLQTADPVGLRAAYESHRAALDQHGVFPLSFSDPFWTQLARGEVARRRDQLDGTDRILAFVLVPASRDTTWVAIQDPHAGTVDGFVDEELPGSTFDRRVVYQRITLPWPLQPRQWVVEVRNNDALRDATAGAVWERSWTLSEARGAKLELEHAVWLPTNEGAWLIVDAAPHGTLVGYHARTSIGGVVPDEAALRWSYGTLTGLLEGVRERAGTWVVPHYDANHVRVLRPDHTAVPSPP